MAVSIHPNPDQSTGFYDAVTGVELGRVGGPASASDASAQYRLQTVAKIPLAAVDTGGGIASWLPDNTRYGDIVVLDVTIDVTTASTAACTVEVGMAATATGVATTFFSAQSVATAGTFISANAGHLVGGHYITASTASGASAGLVGYLYVTYFAV